LTIPRQRIGVYGGAFDPPHNAHTTLARCAMEQLQLSELRIFPTGHAWHKARDLSSAEHRLSMTFLAFSGMSKCIIDASETRRLGPTYTLDTLFTLRAQNPMAQLFLIMGEDQYDDFTNWHRYEEILLIATLSIAARALSSLPQGASDARKPLKIPHHHIQMPAMQISAEDIRARVARGETIDHLVNPAVARYIATHHLYQRS
jgi:nicotinate-nucleotide adenylyltransferase